MSISTSSRFWTLLALAAAVPCLCFAEPKVGVLLKAKASFWYQVETGVKEAAAQQGLNVVIKSPEAEEDIGNQLKLLESLLSEKIDLLIVAPDSPTALTAKIKEIKKKGIPVIVLDSPLSEPIADVFVGTDHAAVGQAAGILLATLARPKDEVCILKYNANSAAAVSREKCAADTLRETFPKVTIHDDMSSAASNENGQENCMQLLSRYPKTKVIFTSATTSTLSMMRVLKDREPWAEIKLVGCGYNFNAEAEAAITSGTMQGWIAQQPKLIGQKSIEAAAKLLKGEKVPATVNTDFVVITRSNIQTAEVRALLPKYTSTASTN